MERQRRTYRSTRRTISAQATRRSVLDAARALFAGRGIDKVTIGDIAREAGVSAPTVFSLFKSKDGILQAIMHASLFGDRFQAAQEVIAGVEDPIVLIALTAKIARAIYESESEELGLMRGASAFSPALRKIESEFEALRFAMQEERLKMLFSAGLQRVELDLPDARRIMWMYTSRDIYRMLVVDGEWSGERYEKWLAGTLKQALVRPERALSD